MGAVKAMGGLLCILPLVLSGCSAKRIDLVRNGFLTVRKVAEAGVRLAVRAYQDEEQLMVRISMSNSRLDAPTIPGDVDVSLIAPGGEVVETHQATRLSTDFPRRGLKYATWGVRFSHLPPPRSTLVVQYHRRHEN